MPVPRRGGKLKSTAEFRLKINNSNLLIDQFPIEIHFREPVIEVLILLIKPTI